MGTRKSQRTISSHHLSDDFAWYSFPSLPDRSPLDLASQAVLSPKHATGLSASKDKKIKVSLPPDSRDQPGKSTSEIIPQSTDELARLRLQKETEALQIERLQLELQLAQLKLPDIPHREKADKQPGEKSLGDLKAPQKIVAPQEWPHIFAPGEPKLFHELTMTKFSTGYAVILKNCQDPLLRSHLLEHFYNLMVLAGSYKWSAVRAFHYKVLRSIEFGPRVLGGLL